MTTTPPVGSTFFGIDISGLGDQLSSLRRQLSKRVLLLEFGNNFLRLSEASITPNGLNLNHMSGVQLPPEALERGVPAEPVKMADLLGEICKEKKIRAHRVAVVLPPEVGFQRLVNLPAELSTDEARQYIQDSKNGVQIPFPLDQTDFDLVPVLSPVIAQQHEEMRPYMLSAIPQQLVDRVIEMLKLADLELQLLELGNLSQLRVLASDLMTLPQNQVDLVLELLPESSNLSMVTSSGLLALERLSAIRDFPEPNLDPEQVTTALDAGLSAESFVVQDDRYLPISDLDLRVLCSDFKKALARFYELCPGAEIRRLQLTGINSAHPMLVELMHSSLGLPVEAYRPMLAIGLSEYSLDDVLVQAGLGRLLGLGLGLLPREQLVVSLPDAANDVDVVSDQVVGTRLDQLIERKSNSISALMLPSLLPESIADVDQQASVQQDSVQQASLMDQEEMLPEIELIEVLDVTSEITRLPKLKEEEVMSELKEEGEEEWPTIGGGELKEEVVMSELKEEGDLDQQGSTEQLDDPPEESLKPPLLPEDASLTIPGFKNDTQAQNPNQQKRSSKNQSIEPAEGADSLGELGFADSDE